MLRNRTVLTAVLIIYILEISIVVYSRNLIFSQAGKNIGTEFNFMQNHLLIFYLPLIIVNIMTIAFSLSQEKSNFLLAKLVPFGESTFLRSKVISSWMISLMLGIPYLLSAVYFCDLKAFLNVNYLISISFYLFFFTLGFSFFSMFFAVSFYNSGNNYEPGLKGITGYMFFISLIVISSFSINTGNLSSYYEYATGLTNDYPNTEFVKMITIGFVFLVFSRILLNSAEKKLMKE